jgi:ERO1-like protein beta
MHASISTHLCYEYLDQKTGAWAPNLTCFEERVGRHPERISNLYFNYGLLVRAVAKLRDHLKGYTFCTGYFVQDRDTKEKVLRVAATAAAAPTIFDESIMFADPKSGIELKEDFRSRFRNVSRLMDCVGCDKCRLWGKLQTAGYGTALKVLFEFDEADDFVLKRTELVALVNTLDRLGTSMAALSEFREMAESGTKHATVSKANDKPSSPSVSEVGLDDEFDEFETSDMRGETPEPSFTEILHEELDLVFRTTKYVFREWMRLPRKIGQVLRYEVLRLFWTWLGLTVEDRVTYEWARAPGRDEL